MSQAGPCSLSAWGWGEGRRDSHPWAGGHAGGAAPGWVKLGRVQCLFMLLLVWLYPSSVTSTVMPCWWIAPKERPMGTRTHTWPWGRWGWRGGGGPMSNAAFWG